MAYTDVFGGQLLFPSQLSYLQITTAVDVTLQWPTEQQITGGNVVADFLDISTTAAALNVDFPDARNTGTGNKSTINNIGGNDFTVRDATGGVIQFVGTGEQWVIVLTDNSTEAGVWSAFQLGAATTLASASALAGAGLQADGFGMLEQIIDSDIEGATPITVVDGDRAKCLIYTAGAGTANLPSPGTVGNNWFFMLRNSGSGTLNIVPGAGNIDGSASLNLDPNGSAFIFTDGSDFYTIGLTVASTIAFDFVSLAVPGSGDFVLSGANLDRISYRFTGALTGNRRIVVPNTTQQYWVDNQTTGAFTLEVSTAAGAGQIIPQGQSAIVYSDATDVINAVSSTSVVFPITIGQGGTGATTVGGAQTNLQVPPDSRLISSGAGLSGGGDLTADRTLSLDINSAATTPTAVAGDFFAFEDIDDNLTYKTTIQDILDLAAITIEDEGVPLVTAADTLDFTGGIVTASGAGTTKTIDIPLAAPGAADSVLRSDGSAWVIPVNISIDSIGRVICDQQLRIRAGAQIGANVNNTLLSTTATITSMSPFGTMVDFVFGLYDSIELNSSLKLFNFGSATDADEAGYGQLYARSGGDITPELVWVDDGGTEYPVIEQGSFSINFDIGFSDIGGNPVTIEYQRIGDVVHITLPSANGGNSNANTLGTGADWPVALRPASTRYGGTMCTENSAEQVWGVFFLNSSGILTFTAPNAGDAGDYGNHWAAAGVKFVNGGWSWTYRITDS